MKNLLKFVFLSSVMALTCCNENMNDPDWADKERSPMEILLEDFYASVHPGSRADVPFEIIGLSKKTYRVENDSVIEISET